MSKPAKIPLPVLGIDNLADETAMPAGTVRTATNVDIYKSGKFARRAGYTQRLATGGLHSLYTAAQKGWMLCMQGPVLNRVDPSTFALTPLLTLPSDAAVDYCEFNGNVYFSNRNAAGWIPSDSSAARFLGVPTPGKPTLTAGSGALSPGKYTLVLTVRDDRGEESAASEVAQIDLSSGGGIVMSNLPADGEVQVYITEPDGDLLRRTAVFPAVFPQYTVTDPPTGATCKTQFMAPMIPGDFVRWHNGRLYTGRNGEVNVSEPFYPGLYSPSYGRIPFSGFLAFVEPVKGGVYVGDSRGVWFLAGGDPTQFEPKRVTPIRAIRGSSVQVPASFFEGLLDINEPAALWLSSAGYMVGTANGDLIALQAGRVQVPMSAQGRSTAILRDGRKQVLTPVNSTTATAFGAADDSPTL